MDQTPPAGGGEPRAYLVRIAVNQALARRSAGERRQETYLGPWLPEPLVESPAKEEHETAESASLAMMVVLETLTPLERTVFVLGDVFACCCPRARRSRYSCWTLRRRRALSLVSTRSPTPTS